MRYLQVLKIVFLISFLVSIGSIGYGFYENAGKSFVGIIIGIVAMIVIIVIVGILFGITNYGNYLNMRPRERTLFLMEKTPTFAIIVIVETMIYFFFFGHIAALSVLMTLGTAFSTPLYKELEKDYENPEE